VTLPFLILLTLAADTGRVEGTVVNGTTGKSAGSGVPIMLFRVDAERRQPVGSVAGATDADGRFAFADQPALEGVVYVPRASWQGVEYLAPKEEMTDLRPGQTIRFGITIYDAAEEEAGPLQVAEHEVQLELDRPGWLTISERVVLHNPGRTTWIGRPVAGAAVASVRRTAGLPLPPDASSAHVYDESLQAMTQDGQVFLHAPLRPGPTQVTMTYGVPIRGFPLTVRRPIAHATGSLIFAYPKRLRVRTAPDLEPVDHPHDSPGGEPLAMSRTRRPLPAGSTFDFTMDEPEVPGEVAWLPIFAGGLALGAGFLLFQRRGREGADDRAALRAERERLLGAVARLDAEHAGGRLGRREHRERREGAMRLLVTLTRDLDGRG